MKIIFYFIILFSIVESGFSQCTPNGNGLVANVNPTPASCPLNGSITISVTASTGGSPYSFTLTSSCLTTPITQSQPTPNYTFSSLQGNCSYTVCISDAGGNIISRPVTVNNTYPLLTSLSIVDSMFTNAQCSKVIATVVGGRTPYSYELFTGNIASGPPNQGPQSSNQFLNINANALYTIRTTDACGQSIVTSINTSAFKLQTINLSESALESCNFIREEIFLNTFFGGDFFQNNDPLAVAEAGLKFPIVVTAKNSLGFNITGYPYTLQPLTAAGWGQSTNTFLSQNLRWSPRIPNNASIYPITFSYTDACGAAANLLVPYNVEFAKAVYVKSIAIFPDTSTCPLKNCIKLDLGGNYVVGNNYPIRLFTNPTTTGTPLQTINYPAQNTFCGLGFNTNYYLKTFDPCLNKDTIVTLTTGNPPVAFTLSLSSCFKYCDNLAQVDFTFTGSNPNSAIATSGPSAFGPYPKSLTLSSTIFGTGNITNLVAGIYNIVFTTKCGETVNKSLTVNAGGLFAQPLVTVTPNGCASSSVKITPNVSATGQMLVYHNTPSGCYNSSEASYYANIIIGQISGGAPLPGSNNISVNNATDSYTLNVTTAGTYVAIISYSQGLPGINNAVSSCYQTVRDTFTVSFNTIPTIVRVYTLPCAAASTYSIVPVAPNASTGTTYTLFASNGTTVIAGPQTSNTFSNINVSVGTSLFIRALDLCGQSSLVPFTITTSTSISGTVSCINIGTNSTANLLQADFINGANYVWTAPNGNTYLGNNPPLVIPSQIGTWNLNTTLQSGPCTTTLNNTFTTTACNILPPPVNDSIKLTANTIGCNVTLNWTTETEQNSLRFDVEESTDNIVWNVVGSKAASGNSTTVLQYSITLTSTRPVVFYRIKLVKINGQFKYSNVVQANTICATSGGGGNDILTVNNNPTNIGFNLSSSTGRGKAVLIFVDAIGRQYLKKPIEVLRGLNVYSFIAPQYLAKDVYFVRIITLDGSWKSNTVKIIWLK